MPDQGFMASTQKLIVSLFVISLIFTKDSLVNFVSITFAGGFQMFISCNNTLNMLKLAQISIRDESQVKVVIHLFWLVDTF